MVYPEDRTYMHFNQRKDGASTDGMHSEGEDTRDCLSILSAEGRMSDNI